MRDGHEVRVDIDFAGRLYRHRIAETRFRAVSAVDHVLPLPHHAQPLIVDAYNLDADAIAMTGREFVDAHVETAVAVDIDDHALGTTDLGADSGRQTIAHGAKARARYEGTVAVDRIVLHGPHLVLPNTDGDQRVALGHLRQQFYRYRPGQTLAVDGEQRMAAFQRIEMGAPGAVVARTSGGIKLRERDAQIGADAQGHDLVLVYFVAIDVDVDDLTVLDELVDVAGHAIVKAHAEREHQIRFVDRHVGGIAAMHAKHVQPQGMRRRHRAQPHDSGRHRTAEFLRQFDQ